VPRPSRPRGLAADAVPCPGLAAAREAAGLTQGALAKAVKPKVARTTVAAWESRRSAPRAVLEQLAPLLGVTVDALAVAPELPGPAEPASTAEVARLAKAARDVLDELLRAIG